MDYLKEIGIIDLEKLSVEEMLLKIREFNQFSLYTVNELYCIQLFDKEEMYIDEDTDCVAEFEGDNLKKALKLALEHIAERTFNNNYDF